MQKIKNFFLSKDFDFEKNADIYNLEDEEYQYVFGLGWQFKPMLNRFAQMDRGVCGKGADINRIIDDIEAYSTINVTDPGFDYSEEADLMKTICDGSKAYEKKLSLASQALDDEIGEWLDGIDPSAIGPEERKADIMYIARIEQIMNRRIVLYQTTDYMNAMMFGLLEDYPPEDADPNDRFSASALPAVTHLPVPDDIESDERQYSPLMNMLHNIVIRDTFAPMYMIHDYDNGNVCVRLWQKENGAYVPCYLSVRKSNVYLDRILQNGRRTIWPGVIEAALRCLRCSDPQEMAEALLGPELENYDPEYLFGENELVLPEISDEYKKTVNEYIQCFFDLYLSLLKTNSLFLEDDVPYVRLIFGLEEMIYVLECCMERTLNVAAPTAKLVRRLIRQCRENILSGGSADNFYLKKRLSICETADDLLTLFGNGTEASPHPRDVFRKNAAKMVAQVQLKSRNLPLTPENLESRTDMVMNNRAFRRFTAKMDIHTMKHATIQTAKAIMEAMRKS